MRLGSRNVTLFTTSIQLAGSIDQADVVGLIRLNGRMPDRVSFMTSTLMLSAFLDFALSVEAS
jgi:hypothetical protein